MTRLRLVGFSANIQRPSKTRTLVEAIAAEAAVRLPVEVRIFDLVDAGPGLGGALSRDQLSLPARRLVEAVEEADALVVGTPVYKGAYTGLFKHLFDLVSPEALAGKPVALAATGGGARHALVVEHALRPLFGFFTALTVPTAVYASDPDFRMAASTPRRSASGWRRPAASSPASPGPGQPRSPLPSPASPGAPGDRPSHAAGGGAGGCRPAGRCASLGRRRHPAHRLPEERHPGRRQAAGRDRGGAEAARRGVTWVEFSFGPPLLEAISLGAIDLGQTGDAPPIFAQAAGGPITYVAAQEAAGSGAAVLVQKDSPLRTLADLKGKRVAFAKASSAHNLTIAALEKAGLTYRDIEPVTLAPADAAAAFARGSVDAWTIWDPYFAIAEMQPTTRVLALATDIAKPNNFFLAHKTVVAERAPCSTRRSLPSAAWRAGARPTGARWRRSSRRAPASRSPRRAGRSTAPTTSSAR